MPTDAKMGLLVPACFEVAPPSIEEYTQFFRRADDLGFHTLWMIDRIFHPFNMMEPLTLLACATAVTTRVRLGTSVLLSLFRNPVQLARTTATLDHLSGGRVTLGISLGGRDYEFEAMGIAKDRRVSRFRENLTLMRKLWAETDVTHHGRFYHLDNVNVWPKPLEKSGIPVIIGGGADAVLKRSGEDADGWVAGTGGDQEFFRQAWQKVQDYARAAGKDPDSLDSGKLMYVFVGEDRAQCRENITKFTQTYYGPQFDVDTNNCAFGSAQQCAEKIQSFIDAGAKTMLLGPTWPDVAQITRIAEEVVPLLR